MDLYSISSAYGRREQGRYGAIVEPMLQHVKIQTAEQKRQVVLAVQDFKVR
jgi:hypothetical protein